MPDFDMAEDAPLFYRNLASFLELGVQAEAEIRALEDVNHDLLLRWVRPARSALAWVNKGDQPIGSMIGLYGDAELLALELCSDQLHRRRAEPTIQESKLPELIALVRQAIDALVHDEGLSSTVRQKLVTKLREVEEALLYYAITGYPGVEEAFEKVIGFVVREPQAQTEETKGWISRIWSGIRVALSGAREIGDTAQSAFAAIESAKDLM